VAGRSVAGMAIDTTLAAHPVAAALAAVDAALDDTAEAGVWSLSDEQLLAAVERSERALARLAGLQLRLVAETDLRALPARHGAPSTAAWLRHRLRLDPRTAGRLVQLATDPDATATRAAVGAGQVSPAQAQVIRGTVAALPPSVRAEAEEFLLGEAGGFDPVQLGKLGKHLREVVDPDRAARDERATHARRELSIVDNGDGTHAVRGLLDDEAAATVRSALDPLAAPCPAADGTPDPRPPKQRHADALVELARRALDHGRLLPGARGARPHVSLTAGLDTLQRLAGAPAAELDWAGPVTAETLRRIACDALLRLVLLDGHGVPLHVGREHRTVTPGLWAALLIRDRGCVFPGCTRPASWCAAHHVVFWSDGGETKLDNLALLCDHHHRVVHHDGWHIQFGPDGHPELIPPPWIDPNAA
jgi:hypothetical protein